jgi:ABC-type oligopeptide transport system ATPase subunit
VHDGSRAAEDDRAGLALEIVGIEKSFRVGHLRPRLRRALEPLTFSVERGEIFGYLGPNGSGKTTTLKILLGLLFADGGTATILGHPHTSRAWRYQAGYLPREKIVVYADMFNLPTAANPVPNPPVVGTQIFVENLERLGLDYESVVSVHAPNPDRPITRRDILASLGR